jgi:hypothetical protein
MGTGREELAARLAEAVEGREGDELVDAVKRLAGELDDRGREQLGELLLERAGREGGFDYALARRISEPALPLFRPRPVEPGLEPPRPRRRGGRSRGG